MGAVGWRCEYECVVVGEEVAEEGPGKQAEVEMEVVEGLPSRIPADAYNQLHRINGGVRWPWVTCGYIAPENTYLR